MTSSVTQGVLLFAHGARAASWRTPFDALKNVVRAHLASVPVELAFLEFMQPDFGCAVETLVQMGCKRIRIELLFLAKGNHTLRDLEELVGQARVKYPSIQFSYSQAMLEEPDLLARTADWIVRDVNGLSGDIAITTHTQTHRIAAGALIEQDGKLLLVRHVKAGVYDYWAPPGGGAQGLEDLKQTAIRETFEEVGLVVQLNQLAYVEEFYQPGLRHIKSWFVASVVGGTLQTNSSDARLEGITEAAFFSAEQMTNLARYPEFLNEYWVDRTDGFKQVSYRGIRAMKFW